jgi:DNA-binding NarL/FixJ family response regulator
MISVLLVDDHASVRESLHALLNSTDDIRVVATALNGVDAVAQAICYWPAVAVIDIAMPYLDGLEAASQIRTRCPATRVAMLSILDHPQYVQRALDAGASGYVLKDAMGADLLAAIRAIHGGDHYFSQKVAGVAKQYIHQLGKNGQSRIDPLLK